MRYSRHGSSIAFAPTIDAMVSAAPAASPAAYWLAASLNHADGAPGTRRVASRNSAPAAATSRPVRARCRAAIVRDTPRAEADPPAAPAPIVRAPPACGHRGVTERVRVEAAPRLPMDPRPPPRSTDGRRDRETSVSLARASATCSRSACAAMCLARAPSARSPRLQPLAVTRRLETPGTLGRRGRARH